MNTMNETIEATKIAKARAARDLFTGALAEALDVALKSKDPIVSEAIHAMIAASTALAAASFEEGLEIGAGNIKRAYGIN
jgi:hypothetical protein